MKPIAGVSHPMHPIAVPAQPKGWAAPEQDWYFTFGTGQRALAVVDSVKSTRKPGEGFPLHNRYVILHGTYDDARRRMERIFGQVWSAMYATADDAGVEEYGGLIELVIT